MNPIVETGLERFLAQPPTWAFEKRLGLLCNPASVNHRLAHARELINTRLPGRLKALFSPQHGFFAEKQDNMIESDDLVDPALEIPVYSLYGKTRIPTQEMFDAIDVLLIDLQDAGTRVYTFIYTMSYCMEAAKAFDKKIVVLDRPNPVGGTRIEGNCLKPECTSFVGRFPIPMRHGMTIGELARLFNDHFHIDCSLDVIPMRGWQRQMLYPDTGLPWVAPSPNLPTPYSAMVYPGQVIWEGTNVSEGRGTTQPFEIFGAPYFDPERILSTIGGRHLPGAALRPMAFEPTSNKWAGKPCKGFQIHITDPELFKPYFTSLALLAAVWRHHRDQFEWKSPPYEYEYERLPIDLILGDVAIRQGIEEATDIQTMAKRWEKDMDHFKSIAQKFMLYP
jgi:uncharacterized protein YbbC (DUF1343 family)